MGKQGFTLMELIVCIAVLAVLAGIGVPYMMGYRDRAAAGVNEVNRLTTQRQIAMVLEAFPGELAGLPRGEAFGAERETIRLTEVWRFMAPAALGVNTGVDAVENGTAMRAWLKSEPGDLSRKVALKEEKWVVTSYWDLTGEGKEEEGPAFPGESVPPETEAPEPAPTVPAHTCRDWDGDCLCDIAGCGKVMHTEKKWENNGNCEKCGIHFVHRGVEDLVCDTCRMDLETGQIHVCGWAEGVCRCKCGVSRCDHGSTKTDQCPVCGEFDYWMDPCPNCERK